MPLESLELPRRTIATILFCACVAFPRLACAALLSPDPTDLWYDPNESGWGLTLTQQGDTIFAVLFVYGTDRAPQWYVASAVQLRDDGGGAPGGPNIAGTLYRTQGPWFGGTFDPHAVTAANVGTLQMRYDSQDGKTLSVQYDVDGVRATKTLQRQAWRDTRSELFGRYLGQVVMQPPAAGCPAVVATIPQNLAPSFSVASGGAPGDIHIIWGTGIDTACSIDGIYAQEGQLASISGYLTCGPIGSQGPPVPAQVYGISHSDWGMNAGLTAQSGDCTYSGRIGGVRAP